RVDEDRYPPFARCHVHCLRDRSHADIARRDARRGPAPWRVRCDPCPWRGRRQIPARPADADFALLGVPGARLAAYCSPKGRMLASMIGIKCTADEVLLVCRRDVLAATLKRLQMFVLRAKVRL